ncbi:hypothetical protein [Natronorubrum sulfidifaciens]|uniref:Uncharacterized protein n=1 Tax=Natronorubrum sulfidifaciens JCM 14089 TaxID=1230460 RepID=L9W7V4_9EURY|nr:hypothetical protein [Natronorubrum sulfidifaciens]ELY44413.1 hypothetical protein C495_10939 [Natronorubrum sulfidifaciens JCM 14089]
MHDVIPTTTCSGRLLFAVSLACFGVAGSVGAADALVPTVGATLVAIAGVFCTAQYAARISRRTLAILAFALWGAFLAVAGIHAVGLATVSAAVPGVTDFVIHSVTAATWATLLAAGSTTAFLGFREYGATSSADAPEEQILEGETSDYSTR